MSPMNVFDISLRARSRYFFLWFNDERMRLINTAWHDDNDDDKDWSRKNSQIIQ